MAVCFDFRLTNVVQLRNRNPYFYRFRCHQPLLPSLHLSIGSGSVFSGIRRIWKSGQNSHDKFRRTWIVLWIDWSPSQLHQEHESARGSVSFLAWLEHNFCVDEMASATCWIRRTKIQVSLKNFVEQYLAIYLYSCFANHISLFKAKRPNEGWTQFFR